MNDQVVASSHDAATFDGALHGRNEYDVKITTARHECVEVDRHQGALRVLDVCGLPRALELHQHLPLEQAMERCVVGDIDLLMIAVFGVEIADGREKRRRAVHHVMVIVAIPIPVDRYRNVFLLAGENLPGLRNRLASLPKARRAWVPGVREAAVAEIATYKQGVFIYPANTRLGFCNEKTVVCETA